MTGSNRAPIGPLSSQNTPELLVLIFRYRSGPR
jgi:hypothetical protein